MLISSTKEAGAEGHYWTKPGEVIEVADSLGLQLIRIPGGGFAEANPDPKLPAPKIAKKAPIKREENTSGDLGEAIQVATGNK